MESIRGIHGVIENDVVALKIIFREFLVNWHLKKEVFKKRCMQGKKNHKKHHLCSEFVVEFNYGLCFIIKSGLPYVIARRNSSSFLTVFTVQVLAESIVLYTSEGYPKSTFPH